MIKLKDILFEGKSLWAPGTGMGTKGKIFTAKTLGRKHPFKRTGEKGEIGQDPSTEYTLSSEELEAINKMTSQQKKSFLAKKLVQARKASGQCIKCRAKLQQVAGVKTTILCPSCIKKNKERKLKFLQKGICPNCYKNPLAVDSNGNKLKYCSDCSKKINASHRNQTLQFQSAGICPRCRKNSVKTGPDGKPMSKCEDCLKKDFNLTNPKNSNWSNYEIEESVLYEIEKLRMANPNLSSLPRPKNRDEWNIDDWTNYWQELKREVPYINLKKPRKPRKPPTPHNQSKWKNIRSALKKFLSSK